MTKKDVEKCKKSSPGKWKKSSKNKKNAGFHKKKFVSNEEQCNKIELLNGNQVSEKTVPEFKRETNNNMNMNIISDEQSNVKGSEMKSPKCISDDSGERSLSKKKKLHNMKLKEKKLMRMQHEKEGLHVDKTNKTFCEESNLKKINKEKESTSMDSSDKQGIQDSELIFSECKSDDLTEVSSSKKKKQYYMKLKEKQRMRKQHKKAGFDVGQKETSNDIDISDNKQSNIQDSEPIFPECKSDDLEKISPSKVNKQGNMKFKEKIHAKKQHKRAGFDVVKTEKEDWEETKIKKEKETNNNMDITDKQSNAKNSKPKSQKRKSGEFAEVSPSKKKKLYNMKFKERKLYWKKKEKAGFDIVKSIKADWDDLRREDCTPEKKNQLLQKMCRVLKGRVKEFAYAHDTVRVLECIIAEGTEEHRTLLFEELKDEIVNLSKSLYGKFFVLKILKYGSKKQKETVMNTFQGIVTKLMKHSNAAEVVETAFNECANALQRFQMVQEFYGANYRHFKESNIHNLKELLEMKPETKNLVINSMKEELMKCLEKTVVKHSLIHHVLLQFFLNCDASSRSDMIESLREVVPEILHTKDGSRVAMQCVWYGDQKDRKIIIKHMKTFVKKIAMEEHGHMVLLALFDCVDDTTLIEKIIIKELQENLLEISQNVHGKKVLIYLLKPRDPHFFHPDVINILKQGDGTAHSKKEPEKRHLELKQAIANPLSELIVNNIADLYKNNAFCLFAATVLKHLVGEQRRKAFESIAKLTAEPFTSENRNVHILEHGGSYFMLKQLILSDIAGPAKGQNLDSVTFSEVLVSTVPNGIMHTWCNCNRGAFLLLNLLETEVPVVLKRVGEELMGFHKHLDKLIFKGAELLVKRLRKLTVDSSCK